MAHTRDATRAYVPQVSRCHDPLPPPPPNPFPQSRHTICLKSAVLRISRGERALQRRERVQSPSTETEEITRSKHPGTHLHSSIDLRLPTPLVFTTQTFGQEKSCPLPIQLTQSR